MGQRETIHVVEESSRLRADLARAAFELGHHAEVYADLAELCEHPPRAGIVLARDDARRGGAPAMLAELVRRGVWLPLVALDEAPGTRQVVEAIKAGALDFLPLPLDPEGLADTIERVGEEARANAEARRRMIEARNRIGNLSTREREVLDWLAQGSSNKEIARELSISPRTVEIHRANMMTKLGAHHAAEAVRIRLEAELEGDIPFDS
jgi:FixJ family two-component response regulator